MLSRDLSLILGSIGQKTGRFFIRYSKAEKGHLEELEQLAFFLKGESDSLPISLKEMVDTSRITLEIKEKLKSREGE